MFARLTLSYDEETSSREDRPRAHRYLNRRAHLPTSRSELTTRLVQADEDWPFTDAERYALEGLLRTVYPDLAIEVGTHRGGSLDVLRRYCRKVYSLDPSPTFRDEHAEDYPNVEFIVGDPARTLPALMERIAARKERLEFVLMDGGHSEAEVRRDLNSLLKHKPWAPVQILVHNSFHPECRGGILSADWAASPYAHMVEADYVTGRLLQGDAETPRGAMSCGLALALLLPEARLGPPIIHENDWLMHRELLRRSVHHRPAGERLLETGRQVASRVAGGGLRQRWKNWRDTDWGEVPSKIRSRIEAGRSPRPDTFGGWRTRSAVDQREALLGGQVPDLPPPGTQGIGGTGTPHGPNEDEPPRLDLQHIRTNVVGRYRGHLVRKGGWLSGRQRR